jgi:hypothetical protein
MTPILDNSALEQMAAVAPSEEGVDVLRGRTDVINAQGELAQSMAKDGGNL